MLGDFQCWISFLCQYNIVQSVSRAKKGGSPQRRSLSKPVFVIVDKHPTHLAKSVAGFLASAVRKLTLFFLPLQSAIPNELVWNDLKAQCVGRKSSRRCHNCGEWSSHTCGSYRSPLRWCEAFSTHLPRVTRHAKGPSKNNSDKLLISGAVRSSDQVQLYSSNFHGMCEG
jgi:hypothetical protein